MEYEQSFEHSLALRRLRFGADMEPAFQSWYYDRIRPTLRIALAPVAAFVLFSLVRDAVFSRMPLYATGMDGFVLALCLLLLGLTFHAGFSRVWQPVTTTIIWAAMTIMLNSPAVTGPRRAPADAPPAPPAFARGQETRPFDDAAPPAGFPDDSPRPSGRRAVSTPSALSEPAPPALRGSPGDQMEAVQLYAILICLVVFRLPFLWATLLNCGLLASAVSVLTLRLHLPAHNVMMFMERSLLVVFTLMISSLLLERLSRSAFLANYLLDQERNDERRRRERTEQMLHVLGQAIGGIVHDLGNPLNAVQGGAQMLRQIIEEGDTDKATLQELTGIVIEGAQMLNYQRVSLMEQTRVLEGKPIPIAPQEASLRHMIEAGARFQQPRFARGRRIALDEGDMPMCVDEMKMVSVFINLIGNAMKYSDGEIRVSWRAQDAATLIAIADQGTAGRGISEAQAQNLFVPFGRLETHANVEGTGLGLLSVRKIAEAHGGSVYIEGRGEGGTASKFKTASGAYPSMLPDGFRTAFVVALPSA